MPNRRHSPDLQSIRRKAGQTVSHSPGSTSSNYIPLLPEELRKEYAKFNASLSPEQRKALGIHSEANPTGEIKPLHKEDECVRVDSFDTATAPQGFNHSTWLDALAHSDPIAPEEQASRTASGYIHIIAVLSIIRKVLRAYEVSAQQHPAVRLHGDCLALALSVPGYGDLSAVAKRHGVSKQAVSKRVRVIASALDLPSYYPSLLSTLPQEAGITLKGYSRPLHPRSRPVSPQSKGNPAKWGNGVGQVGHPPVNTALDNQQEGASGVWVGGGGKESFTPPPLAGRRQQTHPKNRGWKV